MEFTERFTEEQKELIFKALGEFLNELELAGDKDINYYIGISREIGNKIDPDMRYY